MGNDTTDVPGAKIHKIKKRFYVVVNIETMFEGRVSIESLATRLHLQPEAVFNALVTYKVNAHIVKSLYDEQITDAWQGYGHARRELKKCAFVSSYGDDTGGRWVDSYLTWKIWTQKPILLPRSRGFKNLLREASAQRKREARIRAMTPTFDALEKELKAIHLEGKLLRDWIKHLEERTKEEAEELLILEALAGLINCLLKFPHPDVEVDPGDRKDVETLQGRLDKLKAEAYQHMLLNPPRYAALIKEKNATADRLLSRLENATFVKAIKDLVANRDIASHKIWRDACEAFRVAFIALLFSPKQEDVLDRHVMPLIQTLACQPIDTKGLSAPNHPAFLNAVLQVPPAPSSNSVLAILGGLSAVVPQAFGSVPGPNSLSVSIIEVAAPLIMSRYVGKPAQAGRMGGRLFRALVILAGLNQAELADLMSAVENGDLKKIREINWSSRFMSGPAWGAAVAVASCVCLYFAIQSDDENTLRYWSNIIASGSGSALGVSVVLARYSTLIRNGIVTKIGGPVLGIVGGMAAIISGRETAIEEYETGDELGMWLSIGGVAGGALSVAGFLVGAGAAACGTGVGVPVGGVLMLIGAAIGLIAGVWALVRELTTAGSHKSFESLLNHFARIAGPYSLVEDKRPSLKKAFETVQSDHHGVDFWDVSPERIPDLHLLKFAPSHIAVIVDMEETAVKASLRAEKLIK